MLNAFSLPSLFFGIYLIVPLILGCSLVFGVNVPRDTLTKAQRLAGVLYLLDAIYLAIRTAVLAHPGINHEFYRYVFFTLDSVVITYFTYIPYTIVTEQYPKRWSYLWGLLPLAVMPLLLRSETMYLAAWSHLLPFGAGIYVMLRSVRDIRKSDSLLQIMFFFLFVTAVSLLRYLVHGHVWFNIAASLLWTILMVALYIYLVKQKSAKASVAVVAKPKPSVEISRDTQDVNNEAIKQALQRLCIDGQMYLNRDLTIDMLSRECGTNRTYLSTYLHEQLHQSFYDYVNTLRIQKVEQLLSHSKLSQESIALQCGFNSARTMRSAYLKLRGKELSR